MITLCECVEKQSAKVPRYKSVDGVNTYQCPRCFNHIVSRMGFAWVCGELDNYCSKCGQKLDWSELV